MSKITEFQAANGLTTDGSIGPKTLTKLGDILGINSPEKLSHFVGQCAHESGNFTASSENLNYSADGLLKIFPKYFTANALVLGYARKPEKIANRVYANRMGNGDEASGDGYKYRGRGPIQLTGKSNYEAFARFIKDEEVVENPDVVVTKYYWQSALFFFTRNDLWAICSVMNDDAIIKVTKRINGGTHGLQDRITKTKAYYKMLKG